MSESFGRTKEPCLEYFDEPFCAFPFFAMLLLVVAAPDTVAVSGVVVAIAAEAAVAVVAEFEGPETSFPLIFDAEVEFVIVDELFSKVAVEER